MIKVLGQMKNLRRGHNAQGKLKKINIDQTYEGYANFMAPKRMEQIQRDYEYLVKNGKYRDGTKMEMRDEHIFDSRVLKPKIDTYLTPEWDEMVPFPASKHVFFVLVRQWSIANQATSTAAWKIRFDGYGPSNYDFKILYKSQIPDDPLYQPQGASHTGGSFADTVCVCNIPGFDCKCKESKTEPTKGPDSALPVPKRGVSIGGCGVPGSQFEGAAIAD